ncbi:unnamed protein product, partial [marine sediment metagenome]
MKTIESKKFAGITFQSENDVNVTQANIDHYISIHYSAKVWHLIQKLHPELTSKKKLFINHLKLLGVVATPEDITKRIPVEKETNVATDNSYKTQSKEMNTLEANVIKWIKNGNSSDKIISAHVEAGYN